MTNATASDASTPPAGVTCDLTSICGALDAVVPVRTERNLLIGTRNLRAFADLTGKWQSEPKDSPKRDWHAVAVIAEIMSRFDVAPSRKSAATPPPPGSCSRGSGRTGG